jgi:hypothetical protein
MSKITVLDNPSATLWFHEGTKIVHHQIHKFLYGEDLRALLSTGSDLIKKHRATKWLSDDRENTAVSSQDEEWASTVFLPTTIAAGWKYWAIVPPKKTIGQLGMDRLSKMLAEKGLEVRFFQNPEEALAWLEKA